MLENRGQWNDSSGEVPPDMLNFKFPDGTVEEDAGEVDVAEKRPDGIIPGSENSTSGQGSKLTAEEYIAAHANDPDFNAEAFRYHQKRLQHRAEKHKAKGALGRAVDRARYFPKSIVKNNELLTDVDYAHIEALRENEDFDRRREADPEFQEWKRMEQVVIQHLKDLRDRPEAEGKNVRALIVGLGGAMLGAVQTGQCYALEKMGFTKKFKYAFGISVGSYILAEFLAGQMDEAVTIPPEECAQPEFIDFTRPGRVVNVEFVADRVMLEGPKKLDQQATLDNPTELYIQVTNTKTGKAEIKKADEVEEGLVPLIHASMAVPAAYGKTVKLGEGEYVDGGFEPWPMEELINKFEDVTDILVLPNIPFEEMAAFKLTGLNWVLAKILPSKGTMGLFKKYARQREELRKTLEYIKTNTGVNVAILWPRRSELTRVSRDPDVIRGATYDAAQDTFEAFGEKGTITVPSYV